MKRKPFIMQSICLSMIIFGMHLCFYDFFLHHGNLFLFAVFLTAGTSWFTVLAAAPFHRLEKRVKLQLKIPWLQNPVADLLLLLTVLFLAGFIVSHLDHFQKDYRVLYDAVKVQYDRYYSGIHKEFHLSSERYHGATGTWLLLGIELGMSLLMSEAFSRRRGMFFGTLPPAMMIAAGLLLGLSPSVPAMMLIICGVLGMQLATEEVKKGGKKHFVQMTASGNKHRRFYPVVLLLLFLIFGAGAAISHATGERVLQGEDKLLKLQHSVERKAVNLGVRAVQSVQRMLGVEQPGVLTNISPVYTGKTVLTLTVDQKPADDIYLRGFTGTRYEDGKWSTKENVTDISKKFVQNDCYQLISQDYDMFRAYGEMQAAQVKEMRRALGSAVSLPEYEDIDMTIHFEKNNLTTFAYFPYFSKLDDDSMGTLMLDYDRSFRRGSEVKEYKVRMQKTTASDRRRIRQNTDILRKGMVVYYDQGSEDYEKSAATFYHFDKDDPYRTTRNADGFPELPADHKYVEVSERILGEYFQYIMSEDLWLPEEGLERTKKLAKELKNSGVVNLSMGKGSNDATVNSIISQMQHYFYTNTAYSQELGSVGMGEDYVEHFLFEQKRGYCEHYATAGAVLFRAMGVPARYVSGYKVKADEFHENEDGTYTAEVADSEAHAWTEVYTVNGGWIVADMTPGIGENMTGDAPLGADPSYTNADQDDGADDSFLEENPNSTAKASDDDSESSEEMETPEPTEQAQQAGTDGDSGTGGGSDKAGMSSLMIKRVLAGGIALAVLLVLWLIWSSQRWKRECRLKQAEGSREYVLALNEQLEQFLGCCGYKEIMRMGDGEYLDFLGKIHPKVRDDGSLEWYYRLLERTRFARDGADGQEVKRCVRLTRSIKRAAWMKQGKWRRLYVRAVKNYPV